MINLLSKMTSQLSKKEIDEIIRLKNTHWNYGRNSQKIFFKKKIKNKDMHNLLYLNKKLIGYTALRYSNYKNLKNKKINYLHFDTMIINKKFQKKNYSVLLMIFNNFIIRKKNKTSILLCNYSLISFYKKFNWKLLNKKILLSFKLTSDKYIMTYN